MTSAPPDPRVLRDAFFAGLPEVAAAAVRGIVEHAAPRPVYVVGGAVRDLLLGRALVDIDLVVEGDAIAIARDALADAHLTTHARFGTAATNVDHTRIDLATARAETYDRPGALPRVRPATIDDDLRRRDFTVNAIALRVDSDARLLDPTGGIDDIAARVVRALHDRSFIDDPTRMFRAVRYAARLGFSLDPGADDLIARSLKYVDAVSGPRLRRELELILLEAAAGDALEMAQQRGLLAAAHDALSWDEGRSAAVAHPPARVAPLPYGFALLAARAQPQGADAVIDRLRLRRDEAAAVRGVAALREAGKLLRRKDAKPSGVVVLLERYAAAAIAAFAETVGDPIAANLALGYLAEWRHVHAQLKGDDLIEMGVPAGPQVQRGLQLVRAARLDGWADDIDDERALVRRFIKSMNDARDARADIEFHFNAN